MNKPKPHSIEELLESLDSRQSVAISNNIIIDGRQMRQSILTALQQINAIDSERIALYFENSYLFSVTLLAALCSNKHIFLLPNVQPEFINSIADQIDLIITDTSIKTSNTDSLQLNPDNPGCQNSTELNLQSGRKQIHLFTSGSTGQPKIISKQLSQLEDEILILDELWGETISNCVIRSTVSHQHIYGLLFRVLWPLCSEHCFDASTYQYPEKMLENILSSKHNLLVSSPAHLKRIPALVDLKSANQHLQVIFSSGGPLDNDSAVQLHELLDSPVIEIFGSTETGGIAYRQQIINSAEQNLPQQNWTVFPGISIKQDAQDNTLFIKSPLIQSPLVLSPLVSSPPVNSPLKNSTAEKSVEENKSEESSTNWFKTGDIITIAADKKSFRHLGRIDSIVKIEEKKLSLIELENQLKTHHYITDCKAVVLPGKRSIIAMTVILNQTGKTQQQQSTKHSFNEILRTHLNEYFEKVVLPRKWRYSDDFPINAQGKTTQIDLQNMFKKDATDRIKTPTIKSLHKIDDNSIEISLYIPQNLHYFNGHFPQQAILPGVVQIDWAIKYAREHLQMPGRFKAMEVIKFHDLILPDTSVVLNLSYVNASNKLKFDFSSADAKFSSGRILMECAE